MIRKEWKRMLALSMTYIMTLSVAAPVKAAEEELGVTTAETAAEVQETPEQFEARTGYHLSEGYTYVLNNGFVILQADGSPQITPVATPEPTPSETPTPTPTQTPEPTVTPTPAGENTPTPTPGQEGAETQEVTEQPAPEPTPAPETTPEAAQETAVEENIPVITAFPQSVEVPVAVEDYRFWTVSASRKAAQAKVVLEIKEEKSQASRSVGRLEEGGICYILRKEDGWYYVESGTVRGFVEKKALRRIGDKNEALLTPVCATELVAPAENQAYAYYRATIQQTVAKKHYALCKGDELNIRADKSTDSEIVGTMKKGNLCYILADETEEWVYVESGEVRGFVKKEYLQTGRKVKKKVNKTGADRFTLAVARVDPKENPARYYTLTSVKTGIPDGAIRDSIVDYASGFLGTVWKEEGTSLCEGIDTSEFVEQIYEAYGYNVTDKDGNIQEQGKVSVDQAKPGDVICYGSGEETSAAGIYVGDGKMVQASETRGKVVIVKIDPEQESFALELFEDTKVIAGSKNISEVNATEAMYGQDLGLFKLTYYCACAKCCGKATGITASGARVAEGETIAVDPSVIPYGTKVIINGHIFTAQDCGSGVKQNHIDIYVDDHERALALGCNYADVHLMK